MIERRPDLEAGSPLLAALIALHVPPSVVIDAQDRVVETHGNLQPFVSAAAVNNAATCHDVATLAKDSSFFDQLVPAIRTEVRDLVRRCRHRRAGLQSGTHAVVVNAGTLLVKPLAVPMPGSETTQVLISFGTLPAKGGASSLPVSVESERRLGQCASLEHSDTCSFELTTRDMSEHLEAIKKVQQYSDRYQFLFESSPDAYLVMEMDDWRISDCNQAAERMLRAPRDRILGKTPAQLSPPAQPDGETSTKAAAQRIQDCLRDGRNRFEWVHRRFDGEDFWVEVTIAVTTLDERAVVFVAWRDISERKAHQAALLNSEKRLQHIIWGTNTGTWEWWVQTGEVRFNETWATIIGYQLDELAPLSIETWTRLAHPDDLEQSGRFLQRHFSGESESYVCEARIKHRLGHWVWVLDRGKVLEWTKNGEPLLMVGTHQDISERKQAEEAIRRSENQFKLFVKSTPVAMAMFDLQMNCLAASHQWGELLNVDAAIQVGRNHYEVFPDLPDHWREVHRRGLEGETIEDSKSRWERQDGSLVWHHWIVKPWTNHDRKVQGIIICFQDQTARIQAEDDMLAARQL